MLYCTIRSIDDINWVVDRVALGETVSLHIGGVRRPRRRGIGVTDGLRLLESRLRELGAELHTGACSSELTRRVRGRGALALPPPCDGGELAGVREPRRPAPGFTPAAITLPHPGLGVPNTAI